MRNRRIGPGARIAVVYAIMTPVWLSPVQSTAGDPDLASYDTRIKDEDRTHWAFQPIRRPEVPEVREGSWAFHPIDRFVRARLETAGWEPAPAAAPRALVRRLFLDVTGLPPTPAEQDEFLRAIESRPDAVERLVDDLLARPAYGERWGRHWLDLVRYAESNGYERDAAKPFAWRYRDYVIRAFNDDKPFDRFVLEQIAGDEFPDGERTAETLVATGYFRLGPWDDEPADPEQDRFDQLDDLVSTTSQVFLGLTLACARCHNHKFEPLTMHDYYRMVAIFNSLQRPRKARNELALPIGSPAELAAQAHRDATLATLEATLKATKKGEASPARDARIDETATAIARLRRESPDLPLGYFFHEPSTVPAETHLLLRGQAASPGPRVEPGFPAVLVRDQRPRSIPAEGGTTTRSRLGLARWLVGPENPLTARVIVNRVWQGHFGVGLVPSSSDFGTMGDPPNHPEFLDWLAAWFVENGWSIKALHRLILTSATYQMSTQTHAAHATEDPENQFLWRMPYRRLEVEVIRDAMLAASGRLDRRMYGPSMYPFIPVAALQGHSDPAKVWKSSDEATASRRTVYAFIKRSLVVPMLELLDLCDTARSSARRSVTSVPTQALTLLNGDFVNRQASHLADRLEREAGDAPADQVELAFLLTLCRPPTEAERRTMVEFLTDEAEVEAAAGADAGAQPIHDRHAALVQCCRAIFNTNEFVYPD